ncbi:PAS domain-containing protein [Pseudooceanicola nanhaiensis]|uniref:PAS domain-containing protein n=1 Tax=Pseudooceanicola nanhaiensis TaxID=375761 RepID=UPI001CD3DBBE|nr:PAS domain-containing protein [Pseudooceanicola nanhaiensis]MCA0919305.1 PAS domain-containing protein [Pseudooceanicola nanhaiensis]
MTSPPHKTRPKRFLRRLINTLEHLDTAEMAMRREEARRSFLLKLSDAMRPQSGADAIIAQATRMIAEEFAVANANYALIEREDGKAHFVARNSYAAPGRQSFDGRYLLSDFPGLTRSLLEGKTLAVDDILQDIRLTRADKAAYAALDIGSFVVAPLLKDGELIAVFTAHDPRPRRWQDDEISLMEEVASRIWSDIERVSAELALRVSEQQFRALVTATSDVVYRMRPDWREIRDLQGTALPPNVPISKTAWLQNYIAPADQTELSAAIKTAIEGREPFQLEHRIMRPDGTEGWVHSRAVPLMDESGEITDWFGAATDVTERKVAEEAVRDAELRLRLAQDSAGVATFDWLIQTNEGRWSPEALNMLGLQEGALGGSYEDWIAMVHPEDRAEAARRLEVALEMGEFEGEWRVIRPDGEVVWLLIRGQVQYDEADRPKRLTGAQVDITERVHSEQRARLLQDHIDSQIALFHEWLRDTDI